MRVFRLSHRGDGNDLSELVAKVVTGENADSEPNILVVHNAE